MTDIAYESAGDVAIQNRRYVSTDDFFSTPSNLVSAPIRRINVAVEFLGIRDLHVGGIPFYQLPGEALRHATEQEGFGHRTLELKIGKRGLCFSLACADPLIDGSVGPRCARLPGRLLV